MNKGTGKVIKYLNYTTAIVECVPDVQIKDGDVVWIFKNLVISRSNPKYVFESKVRTETKVLGLTVGMVYSLRIENVQRNDSGEYICVLTDALWRGGESVHQVTNLTVDGES